MEIKGPGPKRWLADVAADRVEAALEEVAQHGPDKVGLSPAESKKLHKGLGPLLAAKLPEKLVHAHLASLVPATADAARLAALLDKLEPRRAKAFERVLSGQLYKTLGAALDAAPEALREKLAVDALKAARELAEQMGPGDHLGPALTAMVGLVDTQLRLEKQRRLVRDPKSVASAFSKAAQEVRTLYAGLSGRSGIWTSLALFPAFVEQLARAVPQLDAAGLGALSQAAAGFLIEVGPRSGLSQDAGGRLSRALSVTLENKPGPVEHVLAEAGRLFAKDHARDRADLKEQLAQPSELPARSPSRADYDRLVAALGSVAQAHPTASKSLLAAIYDTRAFLQQRLVQQQNYHQQRHPTYAAIIALIEKLAPSPLAEAALLFVKTNFDRLCGQPAAAVVLEKAARAPGPGAMAAGLVESLRIAAQGQAQAAVPVKDAIAAIERLDNVAVLQAAFALESHWLQGNADVAAEIVREVSAAAKRPARDGAVSAFASFLSNKKAFLDALTRYNVPANQVQKRGALASALAEAAKGELGNTPNNLAYMAQITQQQFPKLELDALVADSPGGPGLYSAADQQIGWRVPPQQLIGQLYRSLSQARVGNLDVRAQSAAVRVAIQLAAIVGRMDGEHAVPFQRILADLQAAYTNPKKLHFAAREGSAGRARQAQNPTVEGFLSAHPELPTELAISAGLHLKPAQMAWLVERVAATRGRDTIRQLRDFVFACVSADRLDLFDAVMKSPLPHKTLSRAIASVAREYRANNLKKVPFDRFVNGLKKGKDPTDAIEQEKLKAALGGLKLKEPFDPQGLDELSRCAEAIRNLKEQTVAGKQVDGFDCKLMKAPFESVLQSVADGSWPKVKYEGEVADQILGRMFTAQQRAIWADETIVKSGDAPVGPADPALKKVSYLVKGLAAVLKEIALDHPQLGRLGYTAANLKRVDELFEEQVAALRRKRKGSPDHRALSVAIRPTRDVLALLRLQSLLAKAKGDPATVLAKLAPAMREAKQAVVHSGLVAAAQIMDDLLLLVPRAGPAQDKGGAPSGTYAIDDNSLDALFMSTTGGCIHHANFRRWANINLAANPHEKIVRVFEDDAFKYRACLKLFELDIPGYKGPVLWMNHPNSNGGGNQKHLALLHEHVLRKATLLGIPAVSTGQFGEAPGKLGLASKHVQNAKVIVDDGHTGSTFVDYVWAAFNIRAARGKEARFSTRLGLNVVMPKKAR